MVLTANDAEGLRWTWPGRYEDTKIRVHECFTSISERIRSATMLSRSILSLALSPFVVDFAPVRPGHKQKHGYHELHDDETRYLGSRSGVKNCGGKPNKALITSVRSSAKVCLIHLDHGTWWHQKLSSNAVQPIERHYFIPVEGLKASPCHELGWTYNRSGYSSHNICGRRGKYSFGTVYLDPPKHRSRRSMAWQHQGRFAWSLPAAPKPSHWCK